MPIRAEFGMLGDKKLERTLEKLGAAVEKKLLRRALGKAVKIAVDPITAVLPQAGEGQATGELRSNVGTRVRSYRKTGYIYAIAGPLWPRGRMAHWPEAGTKVRKTERGTHRGKIIGTFAVKGVLDKLRPRMLNIAQTELRRQILREARKSGRWF